MHGQLSSFSAAQDGLNNLSADALQRRSATRTFEKVFNTARRSRWLARFTGNDNQLAQFKDCVLGGDLMRQHYEGVQVIALEKIVGTENRSEEFDGDFRPVADHVEGRWVGLATAYLQGTPLPPIELLRVGDDYFVRDGHHRVSVFRAYNQATVEAIVTAIG